MTGITSRYREHGWWRDQTFLDDLRRNAAEQPGKPALIGYRVRDGQTRIVSHAELARLTDSFASALAGLGICRGDVVAVQLPNWWEIAPLGLACARIGARLCLMMPIYRRYEIEHILRRTDARMCITLTEWAGARLAEVVTELAGRLPGLKHVVVADPVPGGEHPAGTLSFAEHFGTALDWPGPPAAAPPAQAGAPAQAAGVPGGAELGPDEPFLILFTSGTTGEAKGVVHTQNTLYSGCLSYAGPLGLDGSAVIFVAHAATHYTGFVLGMLLPVMLGASSLVQDVWDADTHLGLAQRYGVTTLYGAPYILADLIAAQRAAPRDVSRLTSVVTGSAPVPPHVVQQAAQVLGARVTSLWGMTENGATTVTRREDPDDWAAHSDGRPVDAMQVRIDPLAGQPDGSGRLWVRGANQCLGYYGREDLYAAALDDDGWFDTGDLARDDGRGGIRITGRVKDIVIREALNVPVNEIEGILSRHPRVGEIAIIGLPDRGVDEMVCAVVVPEPAPHEPPGLEELRAHLAAEGIARWFWPERLEIVDELPKTITGKIRKAELRQRFGGA